MYKHMNKTTGKSYIGCTQFTIEKRWREHNPKSKPVYMIRDNIKTKYDSASILSKKLNIPLSTICRWAKMGKYSAKHNLTVEYI